MTEKEIIAAEKRYRLQQQRQRRKERADEQFRARLRKEFEEWIVMVEAQDRDGSGIANGLIGWLSGAARLSSADPDLDNRLSLLLYGRPRGKREP